MEHLEPVDGGDEAVAELMAQHGAARYADLDTIAACLGRPTPGDGDDEPATG